MPDPADGPLEPRAVLADIFDDDTPRYPHLPRDPLLAKLRELSAELRAAGEDFDADSVDRLVGVVEQAGEYIAVGAGLLLGSTASEDLWHHARRMRAAGGAAPAAPLEARPDGEDQAH